MVQMRLCSIFHPWPEYKLHMIESVGVLVPAWQWQHHKDTPPPLFADSDSNLTFLSGGWHPTSGNFFRQSTNGLAPSLHIHAAQVAAVEWQQ